MDCEASPVFTMIRSHSSIVTECVNLQLASSRLEAAPSSRESSLPDIVHRLCRLSGCIALLQ